MRFIKEKELTEASLSRLWQHTKGKSTFAIIGSQDQDTKESRLPELVDEIRVLSRNKAGIGYNYIEGTYTYENGEIGTEDSIIIYNLSKGDALNIGRKLNQETVIWKDENFFGMIKCGDGSVDFEFDNKDKNMNFSPDAIKQFSSRLRGKGHAKNAPFVFELYLREHNKQTHLDEKYLLIRM